MSDGVTVDVPDLRRLVQDIRRANVEASKELKKEFRRIGNVILPEARANARSVLPKRLARRAISQVQTAADNDRASIVFRKAGKGQPGQIARVFEFGSLRNRGQIRHPLFGNRGRWYQFPTRPFVQPAIDARQDWARREVQQAIETAMKKANIWGGVKLRA